MTKTTYRPRRAAAKYLEGAPEYVLSVHDFGEGLDRYTVCLGGSMLDPTLLQDRKVHALGLYPCGARYWLEVAASDRNALGRRIAWGDLPTPVREAVVFSAHPLSAPAFNKEQEQ